MRLPHRPAVKRAPLVADDRGNQVRDWPNAVTSSMPAAWIQPVSSDELNLNQDRTVSRWQIFLEPAADVLSTDRITWEGDTYQVDGDIQSWDTGQPHHQEGFLLLVTGG